MLRGMTLIVLMLAALVAWLSTVFVDQAETVIVTQFGRPVRVLNDTVDEAGLHWKLPYHSVIRIDRRLQIYDPRPSEFLTSEKKNVNLDVFVCWRVAEPQQFLKTLSDFAGAEAWIHDVVWSELSAEVGRNSLEALVSTDPAAYRLDRIVAQVADRCRQRTAGGFGIEVVDVRLKRVSFPSQVRESVFNRMRAERNRMASQYRAEGEEQSMKIRAEADKQQAVLLAQAYAEAEKTRGQAEAEAIRIYAEAHSRDPEFYELMRTLEAYENFLDDKTTVFLSADSELLRYLMQGAKLAEPGALPAGPAAAETAPAVSQ